MDIQQIIKDRYKELPEDIQQAIKSNDLASKFNAIAEKYNLHVDQNGALQTETILVMLGLEPTENYLDNVQKALEIPRNIALSITEDINNEILNNIRTSLRTLQEQEVESEVIFIPTMPQSKSEIPNLTSPPPLNLPIAPNTSPLEQEGQFTLENDTTPSSSPQYKETNINREELLKNIEDRAIPLVDHLLTTPVNNLPNVETKKVEDKKRPYSTDPYREEV